MPPRREGNRHLKLLSKFESWTFRIFLNIFLEFFENLKFTSKLARQAKGKSNTIREGIAHTITKLLAAPNIKAK
jgi:hypothetical protein